MFTNIIFILEGKISKVRVVRQNTNLIHLHSSKGGRGDNNPNAGGGGLERSREAWQTIKQISNRDETIWAVTVSACNRQEHYHEIIRQLYKMQHKSLQPDRITLLTIINACSRVGALSEARFTHGWININVPENDIVVKTALLKMYGKCGSLVDALNVFNGMENRDVISWTAMISAYAQQGYGAEAMKLFKKMLEEGEKPDRFTFSSVINACGSLGNLEEGMFIHDIIIGNASESDVVLGTAIVKMYGDCGSFNKAREMFEKMQQRNVFTWTVMISASIQHDKNEYALHLFKCMRLGGMAPDRITLFTIPGACSVPNMLVEGRLIHACILRSDFASDTMAMTTLIKMYAQCEDLEASYYLFNRVPHHNVVSWTTLIVGCAQFGCSKEALQLYEHMCTEAVKPDGVILVAILTACANLSALTTGRKVHYQIVDYGYISDLPVGNAIINMYGRCGSLNEAQRAFEKMPCWDRISWNSIITMFAQHGNATMTLQLYRQMQSNAVKADMITFVAIFTACGHAGLLAEGYHYFASISKDPGIMPSIEQYHCIIDLLGRVGQLDEAEDVIHEMPFAQESIAWTILVSACIAHDDVERAKRSTYQLLQVDPSSDRGYVLLSNVYATAKE